ncbi:hypothetical protein BABINDRAFT_22519, partial [Babjeviella inositovora NRRL Y-12698]
YGHNPNQFIDQSQQQFYPNQQQNQPQPQQQQQGLPGNPQFSNFFNDPAASMGMQFTQSAFQSSNQYISSNFNLYIARSHLESYFKISTNYVLRKIFLVLFPYRHKSWSRAVETSSSNDQSTAAFAPPLTDTNAPDLYIPLMGFVTYVLFGAVTAGARGKFHPEILGYNATSTLAFAVIDLLLLKLGIYLLADPSSSTPGVTYGALWDLVALTNYKYVSLIAISILHKVLGLDNKFFAKWAVFGIVFVGWALFLLRSLRDVVLPPSSTGATMYGNGFGNSSSKGRKVKVQFLFVYCFVGEFFIFWFL